MMKEEVTLQIAGSGNAFASGARFNTCFYVTSAGYNFLIDCGASSMVALNKIGADISTLDAIVVSHLHGDHFGGIPFIELALRVGKPLQENPYGRTKPLKIIGPAGIEAAVNTAMKVFFPEFPTSISEFIEYHQYNNLNVDLLEIIAYPAIHSVKTNPHSLRIKINDRIIAFSGDTEWFDGLIELSRDADVFICECSGVDTAKTHMTYRQLLKNKNLLKSKRVILTHMGSEMLALDECEFERTFDGQKIRLTR